MPGIIWFILSQIGVLPCKGNSLATEDDSVPSDAYECRHKQRVDLATFCRDSARYQVPCAPDQRPFAPHQRNSFRDCDPAPICPPVLADIPCEAKPIREIRIIFKKQKSAYKIIFDRSEE